MNLPITKRLEALECRSTRQLAGTIIRIIVGPAEKAAPVERAVVGRIEMLRSDEETEAAFLHRVREEIERSMPFGLVGKALVSSGQAPVLNP